VTSSVLVDTNVVSYLVKGDSRGDRYADDLKDRRLCISFITVAELRFGALYRDWKPKRIERMEQTIRSYVVVPYDDQITREWARIAADAVRAGRNKVDRSDWWIAACAIRHRLPLVTHNPRDFEKIAGLVLVSHPDP
jgi:predicted nucleic acid-binding protein